MWYKANLALSKKPLPPRHFFHVLFFIRVPYLKKLDKTKGRHQAKDHAQFLLLRDSFLDLIPALCFRIHRREDGSLCQSILFVYRYHVLRDIRFTNVEHLLRTGHINRCRTTEMWHCRQRGGRPCLPVQRCAEKNSVNSVKIRCVQGSRTKEIMCAGAVVILCIKD